jgi:hypothetical protein
MQTYIATASTDSSKISGHSILAADDSYKKFLTKTSFSDILFLTCPAPRHHEAQCFLFGLSHIYDLTVNVLG